MTKNSFVAFHISFKGKKVWIGYETQNPLARKRKMATKFVIIDDSHLSEAKEKIANGPLPTGKTLIYNDRKTTGLQLRLQGMKASWVVKCGNTTRVFGYLSPTGHTQYLIALSKVRDIAEVCLAYLKNSSDHKINMFLSAYFEKHLSFKGSHTTLIKVCMTEVEERIDETAKKAKHLQSWSFRECVEKALEDKQKPDSRERIRPATLKDYRTTFDKEAFSKILDKPVTKIEATDIEAIRDEVRLNSGISPAIKVITYTRSVLNYCCKNYSVSGLDKNRPWWRMLNAPWEIIPKDREPSLRDIIRSLILAENYLDKPLPGRAINARGVNRRTLGGLWWIVLTCQRVSAGLSLQTYDIIDDEDDKDWKIAVWAADVMKNGGVHALPIPANAWKQIQEYVGSAGELLKGTWVFPSETNCEKHVSSSGVYRILYRLAARDPVGKFGLDLTADSEMDEAIPSGQKLKEKSKRTRSRDLFEENGISWWTPHDLRRALTTELKMKEIVGGASLIMAHEIDTTEKLNVKMSGQQLEEFLTTRAARITNFAYNGAAPHLKVKKKAMQIWCDAVLNEYARQQNLIQILGEEI